MFQCFDAADEFRLLAQKIDYFLYVDGKTSPKVKEYIPRTEEEYREFLDGLRRRMWDEHTEMMEDMGYEM